MKTNDEDKKSRSRGAEESKCGTPEPTHSLRRNPERGS
jgi:hypothetical protein